MRSHKPEYTTYLFEHLCLIFYWFYKTIAILALKSAKRGYKNTDLATIIKFAKTL